MDLILGLELPCLFSCQRYLTVLELKTHEFILHLFQMAWTLASDSTGSELSSRGLDFNF